MAALVLSSGVFPDLTHISLTGGLPLNLNILSKANSRSLASELLHSNDLRTFNNFHCEHFRPMTAQKELQNLELFVSACE